MTEIDYALSAELTPPHQQDVKDVLAISNERIASCSRDGSIAIWDKDDAESGSNTYGLKALLGGHHAYVNSLAYIPAGPQGPLLASGGNSSLILLHSLDTLDPEPVQCLIGHSLNVCVLAYSEKRGELVSGSWDMTARVWARGSGRRRGTGDDKESDGRTEEVRSESGREEEGEKSGEWECRMVLDGHSQAVWGVVGIQEGNHAGGYLTGSADQLVILWSNLGEPLAHFKGYPEPVRGVIILPAPQNTQSQSQSESHGSEDAEEQLFASACNDGLIRISNLSGKICKTLTGHTDSVFQLRNGRESGMISCGEDHTARIWDEHADPAGVLKHPCQTVWAVSVLPNGDVVTGGSDGRVRVWTRDEERFADGAVREAYEAKAEEAMRATAAARVPRLVSNAGEVAPPRDMVIDIDVSDDEPPLKLSFSSEDDPRTTAEEFVKEHKLPESYADRIDEFIRLHL